MATNQTKQEKKKKKQQQQKKSATCWWHKKERRFASVKIAPLFVVIVLSLLFAILEPLWNVEASPIVNLMGTHYAELQALAPSRRSKPHVLRPFVAYLREPMPWEDGYFDPTYHVWPKGSSDKQQSGGGSSASSTAVKKRSIGLVAD